MPTGSCTPCFLLAVIPMAGDGIAGVPAQTRFGVKIDPSDPAFNTGPGTAGDESLPAVYVFSNSPDGDGPAYSIAEDGTVLGSHICSHWGYLRHDLAETPHRRAALEAHYPNGYRLVVLTTPGSLPPVEVLERHRPGDGNG